MKKTVFYFTLFSGLLFVQSCSQGTNNKERDTHHLAQKITIADAHINMNHRLHKNDKQDQVLPFRYKDAKHGGLNNAFIAIQLAGPNQKGTNSAVTTDSLIHDIREFATHHSDHFAIATSPEEVRKHEKNDVVSLSFGLASTAALNKNVNNVQKMYNQGVRYINIRKSADNSLSLANSDSSQTQQRLSSFGKKLVKKMNKTGMMIDVSGVDDSTFFQVLKMSKAPVIASHASARYFTPGFKGNLSDSMLTAIGKNGGVVMVNFGSDFISDSSRISADSIRVHFKNWLKEKNMKASAPEAQKYLREYRKESFRYANLSDVANNIDYIANLVGIDHVGIGSNFGLNRNTMPLHLQNVSNYPNLIKELLKRGYIKDDIRKICYENFYRVWNKVDAVGKQLSSKPK